MASDPNLVCKGNWLQESGMPVELKGLLFVHVGIYSVWLPVPVARGFGFND